MNYCVLKIALTREENSPEFQKEIPPKNQGKAKLLRPVHSEELHLDIYLYDMSQQLGLFLFLSNLWIKKVNASSVKGPL